ncbi:DUF4265 domain-containing protein [Paraburkholderia sp. Ac-20347]|uniref:DUF4265 domain-containing protein n=1 Tax=Paraburkholderia sp. Ac-20347 TaxID=2703892 RepID=UPI00197E2DFC|nr:DUF4265 domain-containing protein [Paraburkholderia sp. Ac-20347]MBN3809667.1 DUF4265 domain-containing protein [Paraburkholderia sp. Ac-20347]
MGVDKDNRVIRVYAGHNELGPVYEELQAVQLDDGSCELLASPGLALNLAKGDLVCIDDVSRPAVVLKRGGNFCIQIYADAIPDTEVARLERDVANESGGSLDGINNGNLALTVPSINGLASINKFFDEFKRRTGIEWYYSNVYKNFEDPTDETLLNWWREN